MNQKDFRKQVYIRPTISIVAVRQENLLNSGSGNAGNIGYGGGDGDAKSWIGEYEDEENSSTESRNINNVWED